VNAGQPNLTRREREVLRWLMLGSSDKVIAHALQVELQTVKGHLQRMRPKCGARNRMQLVVWALSNGFTPQGGGGNCANTTHDRPE
jgi:two-component system nitrate/nitrite response regulator NarL